MVEILQQFSVAKYIHVLVVLTVFFFIAFQVSFCSSSPKNFRESCCHFLENKNVIVFSVVMVTLLYHSSFVIIPLLHGNSDALNQSHLRKFLYYNILLVYPSAVNVDVQGTAKWIELNIINIIAALKS